MDFLAGEAYEESEWLQVHNAAIATEEEYTEMMGNDPGPFGEDPDIDVSESSVVRAILGDAGSITKNQNTPDPGI